MNKELGKLRSHIPSVIPPGQTYISEENFDKILNILRKDLIKLMVKKVSKNTAISADFIVETIEKQFMTQLLMDKLNSIDMNANYYVHPITHPAQMIVTDEDRRFVSDEEKTLYADKYTKVEVDNKLLQILNSLDWKESVKTFADLFTKYPNPEEGWTVNVTDEDATYRWSKKENKWILISANSIPLVTELVDGLMRKEDYLKLLKLPDKITLDKRFLYKVNNSIGNTSEITDELSVDSLTTEGNYYIKVSNEYLWVFNDTRNKVVIQNKINTSGILMSRTGNIGNDNSISWQKWVKVNAGDGLSFKVYQPAHGFTFNAIRYNGTTQLYELADITTGADGCAIKIDNDNFNFIISGQGVIPTDVTDDLSGGFLVDEYYFLSNTVSGKFQRKKPSSGLFQSIFHTRPSLETPGVILADINIGQPIRMSINQVSTDHNHDSIYAKLSGANFTGSVNIDGTLTVTTGILCNGSVTAFATSDERLKGEMKVILNPLDILKDIHGYLYERPEAPGIIEAGVKAQDFKNKYPYILGSTEIKGESYLTVEYDKIIPLLIESIHELEDKINNTLWNRFKRFMSSLFK